MKEPTPLKLHYPFDKGLYLNSWNFVKVAPINVKGKCFNIVGIIKGFAKFSLVYSEFGYKFWRVCSRGTFPDL